MLIRIHINELDIAGVEDYYLSSKERLSTVDGAFGHSMWRGADDRADLMVVFEFKDMDAAERGLQALSGIRLLAESQAADYNPADLIHVQVTGRNGARISAAPKPAYLSMSVRVADPGFGNDLIEELGNIFQELSLIPGYAGSVQGFSDSLREEAVGIVTWATRDAFEASVPPSVRPYKVRLYERVF